MCRKTPWCTTMKATLLISLVLLAYAAPTVARADLVVETVTVGNPGNAGEWSGESYGGYGPDRICGAVDYTYNIGKYEVTAGQYTEFLNAVAGVDTLWPVQRRTCGRTTMVPRFGNCGS